ncbi:sulfatase [Psychrosphaera sp. F3M07]|nr:sulfatase [Psychrosphaera sp. F3M07]MBU2918843.1 sulfatase [Psychrosphaera sp. F3M07]
MPAAANSDTKEQPNILFILSDDAGYADFGFHGSTEIPTPNLDQLASQGMRFTQAYVSAAVCGPSRAGIMTGKYQQRFGFEENNVPGYMSPNGTTGDDMGLPLEQKTMADYLKLQGYRTALFGKWHQGNADRFHPLKRGFDEFSGFRGGARSFWPFNQDNPNERLEDFHEIGFAQYAEPKQYYTDELASQTIDFIKRHKQQPWFAFVSLTAPHAPMHATKEDLAQFPELTGVRKIYAAMMLNMDRNIGRILKELDKLNLAENTLVVFTNDNGGPTDHNASNNYPLSGTKANHLEGGIRVPMLIRWQNVTQPGVRFEYPVSLLDLLPTFNAAANGDNIDGLDGVSLKPYLTGNNQQRPHQTLYWKKENRGAIRYLDWKLLRFPDRPAELYDLHQDPSEINNLASIHPEKVKTLYKKLFNWELTLERSAWQLKRVYEGHAMKRMDSYRAHKPNKSKQ